MLNRHSSWGDLLFILLLAPCIAITFYALARGWVTTVQRGAARKRAVAQLRTIASAMLFAIYIVGFGVFVYVHYLQHH